MSLLDYLKGNYQRHTAEWTPITPHSSSWFAEQRRETAAGIPVNPESALNCAAAIACTRARSETLASLPAVVYEHQDGDQRRRARQSWLWSLLHDQPNPHMDSMTWYGINATRLVNRGNAVSIKEFNGRGEVIALWPVHNSRWQAYRLPSRQVGGRWFPGDLIYRVWPDESNRHYDVPADEVLNIVGWDTEDGVVGRGVVARARQEIALDLATQQYGASMFKNGAIPLGVISVPWIEDETERTNFRADINAMHSGRENWNKVGILWGENAKWQNLNFSPKDVQAIESRSFTSKSICRFYDVPPAIVQIFDDYKFATVEAMLKHFVTLTVRRDAVRFERAIGVQILADVPDEQLFLEFALEGLLRGDPKAQAETNAILRQWGILNADEWRARDLNLNPLPGGVGEAYLAPTNFATLEQVVAGQHSGAGEGQGSPHQAAIWQKAYLAALLQMTSATHGATANLTQRHKGTEESSTLRASVPPCEPSSLCPSPLAGEGRGGGEISSPPAAEEPPEDPRQASDPVDRAIVHMRQNDANAIRRLAAKGADGFIARIEAHYEKFRRPLQSAIRLAVPDVPTAHEPLVEAYCRASIARLLTACECPPAEFPAAIERCLAGWQSRRIADDVSVSFHLSPVP